MSQFQIAETIAVSACLLGFAMAYDGKPRLDPSVIEKIKGKIVLPVCPEVFGGMTTPRIPSEIQKDGVSVHNEIGEDVSTYFQSGTIKTLSILRQYHCEKAILKDGSPSCGTNTIYDGTFSRTKILGEGVCCGYLRSQGIQVSE